MLQGGAKMWAITRYLVLGRIVGSRGHLYVLAALGLLLGLGLTAGSALAGRLGEGAVAPSNPIGTMPGVLAHAANASKDGPTATPTNTPSPTSTPDCGLSWRLVP